MTNLRFKSTDLFNFTLSLLKAAEVHSEDAQVVADHLVEANLRGVDTHGVSRLGIYLERVKHGVITTPAKIEVLHETPVSALIDGYHSFGQMVALRAMEIALEKAFVSGLYIVGVRRSTHCGMLGYYTRRMAQRGCIGIALTNGPACMAPWGGKSPYLGANPLSIGFPTWKEEPVVLDISTSLVARGKIILAAQQGKEIPLGWAVDDKGLPTTNAEAALKGLVLPMGGYKGYGLALMVDILSAVMTGADFGPHQVSVYGDLDRPQNTGHFFAAIRPDLFTAEEEFIFRMDTLIQEIHGCPKAEGVKEIFLPGEPESHTKAEREANGVPMSRALATELSQLGKDYGVTFPSPITEDNKM